MTDSTSVSRLLTLQLVVCAVAVVSLLYLPLAILPQLAATYQLGPERAGAALSAFGFAYALGFLVAGPLSDRLGRKVVMVSGLLALAVISVGLAAVTTGQSLLVGRALQGFAAASFPPAALAYLAERGTPRQRAWGVAWMSTAFLSAGLLGQIYGSVVAGRWGFGMALLPLSCIYIVTAACVYREGVEVARQRVLPSPGFRNSSALKALLSNVPLWKVYAPAAVLLMCFVAFYIGLDSRFGEAFAASGIDRLTVREVAIPGFLMPLVVASLIPRWGPARIASLGLAVATVGLIAAAASVDGAPWQLLVASIVFVAGIGISVPALIARTATVAEMHVRGLAIAIYTFVLFVGASLGPWVAQQSASLPSRGFFGLLAFLMGLGAAFSLTRAK